MTTTFARPNGVNLRPYQEEGIAAARKCWAQGQRNAMIVLPTGTGKTITALSQVATAGRAGHRVLWLAHREELLEQPLRSLRGLWPDVGADSGIVQADRDDCRAAVVAASIDTLRNPKRLARYLEAGVPRLVVVDEAHHSAADSWVRLLDALDAAGTEAHGGIPYKIGLTATPDRADGKSLAGRWALAFAYSLIRAFNEGALVRPIFERELLPELDLGDVGGGSDWDAEELGAAMMAAGVVGHTVDAMRRHAADRRSIIFTATVEQARQTADALRASGVEARWVSGETPTDQRKRLLSAFMDGTVRVLCNAQVLTEGTDLPPADCVVMARPTRSRPLYMQAIGRGLRLYPGKENCLIIDLVGASEEHRMIVAPVLLGELEREEREKEVIERSEGIRRESGKWKRYKRPEAAWVRIEGLDRETWAVDCGEHGVVVAIAADVGFLPTLLGKGRDVLPLADAPVDFDLARGLGEDVARQARALTWGKSKWRKGEPTGQQAQMLANFGHASLDGLTKGEANDLITLELTKRRVAKLGLANRTDKAAS